MSKHLGQWKGKNSLLAGRNQAMRGTAICWDWFGVRGGRQFFFFLITHLFGVWFQVKGVNILTVFTQAVLASNCLLDLALLF